MNIQSRVSKATGREVQRSLFISNIGKMFADMDRMESVVSSRNAKLDKLASSYLDSGMTAEETVELLVEDGFEVEIVRNYVTAMNVDLDDDEEHMWDFAYETVNGNIKRGSDNGLLVSAATREEAMRMAQDILDDRSVFEISERVIDAEKFKK
jgi:hypothetical protein